MFASALANPTIFWGVVGFAGAAAASVGLAALKFVTGDADMV
jgi:hypothetical protein